MGQAEPGCLFFGMFSKGHHSGQDESYTKETVPQSPKRHSGRGSQSPKVGKTLCKKLQECLQAQEVSLDDLSSLDNICHKSDFNPPDEKRTSDSLDDSGVVEDIITISSETIKNEDADSSSTNIVEHILKELKGINKIQEEISDLREYLTSVRGSVDEVSCCVDAVLSEIGDMYSGASAAPHSPVLQIPSLRQGHLDRQNAVTSLHSSPLFDHKDCGKDFDCIPPHRSPLKWPLDLVQWNQQTGLEKMHLSPSKPDSPYLELQCHQDCQSTSSFSSYNSLSGLRGCTKYEGWPSVEMRHSVSGQGQWSEEDLCSTCVNSTPGQSSHTSSEHLSLLFGQHYNSPSSSSSMMDWEPSRLQADKQTLECDCAANCPYSHSSGYHTADVCANEGDNALSRSLSCSTVLWTDCDDGYLETQSHCDDCPSSGDTLDLGSADSLDRDWTDPSISRDDTAESLSLASSEMHSENTAKSAAVGFDVPTFTKAVLSFRSTLKGAFTKLDGSNLEVYDTTIVQSSEISEKQCSAESTDEVSLTEIHTDFETPKDESEPSVYVSCAFETQQNLSSSFQASPSEVCQSSCSLTKCHSLEVSHEDKKSISPTDVKLSTPDPTLEYSPANQVESPVVPFLSPQSSDEVRLSPILENNILEETVSEKPTDPSHRERIANFQRILREKRQTRHRLSKSAQGSQGSYGSHGSQGSQGSQSQDEFFPGIYVII